MLSTTVRVWKGLKLGGVEISLLKSGERARVVDCSSAIVLFGQGAVKVNFPCVVETIFISRGVICQTR